MKRALSKAARGFTLVELMIASAVGTLAVAAVLAGAIAMQRCFVAAEDFAVAKTDQARLSDYIALDLRRALSVTVGTGGTIMTMQIPDYYDANGLPRTPTIINYVASYGNPTEPVTVVYRKVGSSIFRQENAETPREIAANVEDFQFQFPDFETTAKVVKTQVTFAPRFQRTATAAARTATTVYNTTLLRNKQKDP